MPKANLSDDCTSDRCINSMRSSGVTATILDYRYVTDTILATTDVNNTDVNGYQLGHGPDNFR